MRDNPAAEQWELRVDGELAVLAAYQDKGGQRTFTHTETQDGFAGKGLASQLVKAALDDAKSRALEVNPVCPFVRGWLDRHPGHFDG